MLEGFVEYVDGFTVRGWARDKNDPKNRLTVHVHLGDEKIGEASAGAYRSDIDAAGLSDGWSGFSFDFPHSVESASLETLSVFAADALGTHCRLERLRLMEGFVEYVDEFNVRGWARDNNSPKTPVIVQVYLDHEKIGETSADEYRSDLEAAGLCDGWSGFSFDFPHRVESALLETVSVFAADALGTHRRLERLRLMNGFVEYVDEFNVRGWARDNASPNTSVIVQVYLDQEKIGETSADMYRCDLEAAGLFDGYSGFSFNSFRKMEGASFETVSVFAVDARGTACPLQKPKPMLAGAKRSPQWIAQARRRQQLDIAHHEKSPILVLGAARSGTSAMASALNLCFGNQDVPEEGHFLHVLSVLKHALVSFYESEGEETTRNTLIQRIPITRALAAIEQTVKTLVDSALNAPVWVDKTPTPEMLDLAPGLLRLWPKARFIFMRRRGLENIASRKMMFPEIELLESCREWAYMMNRWADVRETIGSAYIEVDQHELMTSLPTEIVRLRRFLGLGDGETAKLSQALETSRPQRTMKEWGKTAAIEKLGWSEQEQGLFMEICGPEMRRFGYSYDESYFAEPT